MPSPPPVLLDEWSDHRRPAAGPFTTIGNWEQRWREVVLDGETYHWSKHFEFMKVIDLPGAGFISARAGTLELRRARS